MRRPLSYRVKCGHEGCAEIAFYAPHNRKEYADLDRMYGNGRWRCTRHTQPNEVLGPEDRIKTFEIESRQEPYGLYFGNFGFLSGPGFKVWAKDFPVGTKIKVTAEVILPDTSSSLTSNKPGGE